MVVAAGLGGAHHTAPGGRGGLGRAGEHPRDDDHAQGPAQPGAQGRHAVEVAAAVDRLLATTGVGEAQVDRVFLTGGSSLVPAVRAIFAARFGEARLASGDELTSVASGLALRAADLG